MIERITADPNILGGKPIIRGTRISDSFLIYWLLRFQRKEFSKTTPISRKKIFMPVSGMLLVPVRMKYM